MRSCCHEIIRTDPLFKELNEAQYKPAPYKNALLKLRQTRQFIDSEHDPSNPNKVRKFRSPVLHKALAALLHFFWKMEMVGFVKNFDGTVDLRILAFPAMFVSLNFIWITAYYSLKTLAAIQRGPDE
jgi:hypothetical protein